MYTLFLALIYLKIVLLNCECPHGAMQGSDSSTCYKFFGAALYFDIAEASCQDLSGHLTSISDAFQNAMLADTLQQILLDPTMQVWIGGNKTNSWTWTDGAPFSYTNWAKGEPQPNKNCIVINPPDGLWYSNDCSNPRPHLCKIPSINNTKACPTQPPNKPILACDPDWTYSNITNACYKMIYNLNWTDAENACVNESAHLASIHNSSEDHFLNEFTKASYQFDNQNTPFGYAWVWVGLNDLAGVRSWTDGTPFDYFNWAPSEPNTLDTERCVIILPDQYTGHEDYFHRWADTFCNWQMRAGVCQKPARLN